VAEERYPAVLAVISDGLSISQVAEKVGVSRQTLRTWLARYEAQGLEGLVNRSHRPARCPHQMPAVVEAALLELRRSRPYWGPRRLVFELAKRGVVPVVSESAAYRDRRRLRSTSSVAGSDVGGPIVRCRYGHIWSLSALGRYGLKRTCTNWSIGVRTTPSRNACALQAPRCRDGITLKEEAHTLHWVYR
jgi:transposase